MKLRKTRIKETTKANGSKFYTPEYKWGLWWYSMFDIMAPDGDVWLSVHNPGSGCVGFLTLEKAQDVIDFYIRNINHRKASAIENKHISTKTERYP